LGATLVSLGNRFGCPYGLRGLFGYLKKGKEKKIK
jgi:hypothetical protein